MLEQLVATNNDATLEELCDQLKQQADVLMSRSTVDRMLTKLNLTVKKTLHPTEKESERVQHQRVDFWQHVQGILAKDLILLMSQALISS